MKPKFVFLGKVIVFLAGAYFSGQYLNSYWYIGPIFGVVVLVWNTTSLRELLRLRNCAFLLASTLIYALVSQLLSREFSLAVAIGTVLLPLAHMLFLRVHWKRTLVAIPCIYGSWYLLNIVIYTLSGENAPLVGAFVNMVSSWQAAYLLYMFTPLERLLTRRSRTS